MRRNFQCSTIDGFASRLRKRWASRAPIPNRSEDFDEVCDHAIALLRNENVVEWVAKSFPVVLIDEIQDLDERRLEIIKLLETKTKMYAAGDDFQRLDDDGGPNQACAWLLESHDCTELVEPRRTEVEELLVAADSVRQGRAPVSNRLFRIESTPNPPLAGTWLANDIGWNGANRTIAVLTPTYGVFAQRVLGWVAQNETTRHNGPYQLAVQRSNSDELQTVVGDGEFPENMTDEQIAEAVHDHPRYIKRGMGQWLEKQRRLFGKRVFSSADYMTQLEKLVGNRSIYASRKRKQAMTIHRAKNQEFDNVILLWPAAVQNDGLYKRRLLYNAITRAKERCLVLVQARRSLNDVPFRY